MTDFVPLLTPVVTAVTGVALSIMAAPARRLERLRESIRTDQDILAACTDKEWAGLDTHTTLRAQLLLRMRIFDQIWVLEARERYPVVLRGTEFQVFGGVGTELGLVLASLIIRGPLQAPAWVTLALAVALGITLAYHVEPAHRQLDLRLKFLRSLITDGTSVALRQASDAKWQFWLILATAIGLGGLATHVAETAFRDRSSVSPYYVFLATVAAFGITLAISWAKAVWRPQRGGGSAAAVILDDPIPSAESRDAEAEPPASTLLDSSLRAALHAALEATAGPAARAHLLHDLVQECYSSVKTDSQAERESVARISEAATVHLTAAETGAFRPPQQEDPC